MKSPQKTMRFGIEFELFTLDEKGYVVDGGPALIKRVKKEYPGIEIKKECAKNMIEIITSPNVDVPEAIIKVIKDFEAVSLCAKKEHLLLYAYGTYPGNFNPVFNSDRCYKIKQKVLGKQRFMIAGRCVGMHIHYSLPWGVFNNTTKFLKPLINSKNKENLINIYNICIALDPVLVAFMQSSPFYQGKRLGKDARVIVYRGGKELDYPDGLYANLNKFGGLPTYQSNNTDLLHLITDSRDEWSKILKSKGYKLIYNSILDTLWNPVRINAHGTVEIRGMDMNHPDIVVAIAIMIKFLLKQLHEGNVDVIVSDQAVNEPFKFDGKTILIPPYTYLNNVLQKLSAYGGMADDSVHKYCTAVMKLAKNFIPENKLFLLQPLYDMLASRETSSDRIIKVANNLGFKDNLKPAQAAKLAITLSKDFYNEIIVMKKRLSEFLQK